MVYTLSLMMQRIGSFLSLTEEDDAERYLMMIEEDDDYPPMQVVEMEDHVIIGACQERGQRFSIITS